MEYPHLFSEGKIGDLTIRNRTVMAPMASGMANYDGTPSEQIIGYYEERAKNGLGLLITEVTRVNVLHGAALPRQLSMAYDRHIAPFAAMVERVHAHGTKVFCQLHHPGHQGLSMMGIAGPMSELTGRIWPGYYDKLPEMMRNVGKYPQAADLLVKYFRWPAVVGPSKVPSLLYNQRTRALRKWEIKLLVHEFARAAKRVQLAGGDGVELHAAHGYLIEQFLSPHPNRRTDEYGGSLENRMRFLLEIIAAVRRECGKGFPLAVRLTVDDYYRDIGKPGQGLELEEGVEIARRLEKAGIDAIDVSSGNYETLNWLVETGSFEPGWRKHLAAAVKEAVSIPVLAANLIRSPEQAEAQLAEGIQDFVSLGRPFLADGAWARKAQEGRADEIKRCICCVYCFESVVKNGMAGDCLSCAVNPRLGREKETAEPRVDGDGRVVAVVGAGPAGLSAAETLCARGFKPVVLEQSGSAGGQLKLGSVPPGKDKINWCVEDLEKAARRGGAEIRYNTLATPAALLAMDPYAVLVATGGVPIVPGIPGVERENVCTVNQVLDGTVSLKGQHVAVIGSGLTGLETALKLAEDGNRVMVVEMASEIGPGAYHQNLDDVLLHLKPYSPVFVTSHKLVEIREGEIALEHVKSGERVTRQVDQVVLSVGVKSDNVLAAELGALKERFPRVMVIGDACGPGRIFNAIKGGFDAARDL